MCQAIADFPGESSEDLSFTEGDMIEITREIDENWIRGRLKNKEGIFPASFVIRLDTHTSNSTGKDLLSNLYIKATQRNLKMWPL